MNEKKTSMKNLNFFLNLLFLVFALFSISCSKTTEQPIGLWDDNIKLSQREANFTASADSISITTEGEWWWITSIGVNDNYNYNLQNINLQSTNYTIQDDCFLIERRNARTLFIKMDANTTNAPRILRIGLEAGDYFDGIRITQSAN